MKKNPEPGSKDHIYLLLAYCFFITVIFLISFIAPVRAYTDWNTDFNSFSLGPVSGQYGFTSSGSGTSTISVATLVQGTPNAYINTGVTGQFVHSPTVTDLKSYSSVSVSNLVQFDQLGAGRSQFSVRLPPGGAGAATNCAIELRNTDNTFRVYGATSTTNSLTIAENQVLTYILDIDFASSTNVLCRGRFGSFVSPWQRALVSTTTFSNFSIENVGGGYNAYAFKSLVSSVNGQSTGVITSTSSFICASCTRIISVNPGQGSSTASSTNKAITLYYYVNPVDISSNWLAQDFTLDVTIKDPEGNEETHQQIITTGGNGSYTLFTDTVTTNGTYAVTSQFRQDYIGIPPVDVGDLFYTYFYVGTTSVSYSHTATEQLSIWQQTLGAVSCSIDFPFNSSDFQCMLEYLWRVVSPDPEVLGREIKTLSDKFLFQPPWGYATRFLQIMYAPATTTVPVIGISFSSDLPGFGHELILDPSLSLDTFSFLQSTTSPTQQNQSISFYDQFMIYWTSAWWMIFAFWFVFEIMKMNGVNYTYSSNRSSHTLDLKSTNKHGTTDLNLKK